MSPLVTISIPQALTLDNVKRKINVPYVVVGDQMFLKMASWREMLFLLYSEDAQPAKAFKDVPYRISRKGSPYHWVSLVKPNLYGGEPRGFFASQESYSATVYKFISWAFSYHALPASHEVLHALTKRAAKDKAFAGYPDALEVLKKSWEEDGDIWEQSDYDILYDVVQPMGYLTNLVAPAELSAIFVHKAPPPKQVLEQKLLNPSLSMLRGGLKASKLQF